MSTVSLTQRSSLVPIVRLLGNLSDRLDLPDAELVPWSFKGGELLVRQYAPVGAAAEVCLRVARQLVAQTERPRAGGFWANLNSPRRSSRSVPGCLSPVPLAGYRLAAPAGCAFSTAGDRGSYLF